MGFLRHLRFFRKIKRILMASRRPGLSMSNRVPTGYGGLAALVNAVGLASDLPGIRFLTRLKARLQSRQ
jgi:hypothetical protein